MSGEKLFRARIVWPISRPPIENGVVHVRDGSIVAVGKWGELAGSGGGARRGAGAGEGGDLEVEDLGEVALLPGLVNAHCHLDYTNMAGKISPPARGAFPDWIKAILALKAHWSYTEYADSWVRGARQLLESGVTSVADIEAVPELLPEAWESTPLRVTSLLEMTGVRSAQEPERILTNAFIHGARAIGLGKKLPNADRRRVGFSPHALYSTPPALLFHVAKHLRAENFLAAMHLAESQPEWDMYSSASGPLYDWLKSQRSMEDCGGRSPVQQAERTGILQSGLLVVHANYLGEDDAELLGKNNCSVVHCPRSHEYFGHARFRYEELVAAGVNVCLGTDSLASALPVNGKTATLNLWDEMRVFARNYPGVAPAQILEMATANGARALKSPAGALEEARLADLIAIKYSGPPNSLAENLLSSTARVDKCFIGGAPC